MLLRSLAIPSNPNDILGISGCTEWRFGRVSVISLVKTDVNLLTSVLALLMFVAAGMPEGVCSVGMPWFSLRSDFMKVQNGFWVCFKVFFVEHFFEVGLMAGCT